MAAPASRAQRIWIWTACGALVLFAAIATLVVTGAANTFDDAVRSAVHALDAPELTAITRHVTELGSVGVLLVLCALAALILYLMGRKWDALLLALTLTATMLGNTGLKLLFHRGRPESYYGDVIESFSFPSGHAAFSCCFYVSAAAIAASHARSSAQRVAIFSAAILVVAAIGFSRVYLGVHYPSDVIGGYLVAVMGVAASRVIKLH